MSDLVAEYELNRDMRVDEGMEERVDEIIDMSNKKIVTVLNPNIPNMCEITLTLPQLNDVGLITEFNNIKLTIQSTIQSKPDNCIFNIFSYKNWN